MKFNLKVVKCTNILITVIICVIKIEPQFLTIKPLYSDKKISNNIIKLVFLIELNKHLKYF